MLSSLLPVLLAAVSVGSTVIDLNNHMDQAFITLNDWFRENDNEIVDIPDMIVNSNVSLVGQQRLGLDSWMRTGNCTLEISNDTWTYYIHYGLELLVQTMRSLRINDQKMSAFLRIKENSFHIAFTIHDSGECHVSLDEHRLERLSGIEFGAARSVYDGLDLNDFFQNQLMGAINNVLALNRNNIEEEMQIFCKYLAHQRIEQLPFLPNHLNLVKQIAIIK